ncbi:hypothetical protein IVB30_03275 [Bradyrhizobium sp. 200]|uniref:hypothetical protein n=1 Tax=Bradyrhizobium sp. 200 TaxID=2782665 RepID=UPI002000386A|nr:hypothetical protein [Bradyrhizobium sp. 200]UPJ50463.1 hypothetical protein IVB30_03275 [Bradyrhizobium sp. 200]
MADPSNISLKDRTEYLVLRKFPFARAIDFPPSLNASRGRGTEASPQLRESLAAYRAELASLSSEEIGTRYAAEKDREYQLAVEKARQEERGRFFNQPHAAADFEHWSKLAHWTLDEAVALSFGKAPERVNWEAVSKYLQLSSFAVQYGRRRELALRAAQWKQLYDPVLPGIFLAWAKGLEIELPAALVEAVQKRGPIRDWKSLFDELKTTHAKKEASWTALDEAKDRTIAAKDRVVAALEERVRQLEAQQTSQPPEKQLGARERESLLKLVIGMAVGGYAYKSTARRSEQTTAIADDLAQAGIPLDADTVRKWLREAAELLPRD